MSGVDPNQPDMQSLIENAGANAQDVIGGGFDEMFGENIEEKNEEVLKQQFEEEMEIAEAYGKVLDCKEGTLAYKILDDLLDKTIRKQMWQHNRENADYHGFYREGQYSIVQYIVARIKQARTGKIRGMTRREFIENQSR